MAKLYGVAWQKVWKVRVTKTFGHQAATVLGAIMAILGGRVVQHTVLGMRQQKMFWKWEMFYPRHEMTKFFTV